MTASDEALLLRMGKNEDQYLPPESTRSGDCSSSESSSEELASAPSKLRTGAACGDDVKEEVGTALGLGATASESQTVLKREGFHSQKGGAEEEDKARDSPKGVVAAQDESRCPTKGASTASRGRNASKRLHGRNARQQANPPTPAECEHEENGNTAQKDGSVEPNENTNVPATERLQEAGAGAGLLGLSGGGSGGSGGPGGSGGGNLSDASWSSSEDGQASAVVEGIAKRRGRPAFHGVDDWVGTSPYGSDDDDDDGKTRAASSAAKTAETAGESTKGPGSGWESATTKKTHKQLACVGGGTREEQRQTRRATRRAASAGTAGRAGPPTPSPAASMDGTPFRRSNSELKQKNIVKEGSCGGLSLKLRAAVETMPSPDGPKQRPANSTTQPGNVNVKGGGGFSTRSRNVPTPCGSRAVHTRQSAHSSSARFGGGSIAGWEGGVGRQQKGRPEMGQPGGGAGDTATRETWRHQPLLGGGQSVRTSGSGGSGSGGGNKEGRRGHGDPEPAAAVDGDCGSGESWVVREFKARVEAARRQEEGLL